MCHPSLYTICDVNWKVFASTLAVTTLTELMCILPHAIKKTMNAALKSKF